MMQGELSKSEFAKLAGVTPGRISQLLRDGVISRSALVGEGRNARIKADLAMAMVRDRTDPARRAGTDGSAGSTFLENRARKEGYAADLLALRLGQQRRAWEEEASAALRALFMAVGKAHEVIPGWVEEVIAAERNSGLGAAAGVLRAKSAELRHSIADMILAFKDERLPDRDNGD
jgi:hypothetical protein